MPSSVLASRLFVLAREMNDIVDLMRDASRREPTPNAAYRMASHARELSGAALVAVEWAREIGADPDPSEAA